jgi:hypothetical protein
LRRLSREPIGRCSWEQTRLESQENDTQG